MKKAAYEIYSTYPLAGGGWLSDVDPVEGLAIVRQSMGAIVLLRDEWDEYDDGGASPVETHYGPWQIYPEPIRRSRGGRGSRG